MIKNCIATFCYCPQCKHDKHSASRDSLAEMI